MELSTAPNKIMSSRETAEITGKRHSDVMRDIRSMYDQLGESINALAYFDAQNKERREYQLDKSYTLLLVSGYNVKIRKAIIDRWEQLEGGVPALPDFTNPEVITGLLTTLQSTQEENKRLNRICNDLSKQLSSGITAPQFAKLLNGVNSQKIQTHLVAKCYLKHTHGGAIRGIRVLSKGRNSGYFVQNWTDRKDFKVGSAIVTERGATWLYSQYQKGLLPMLASWNGSYANDLYLAEPPIVHPQLSIVGGDK